MAEPHNQAVHHLTWRVTVSTGDRSGIMRDCLTVSNRDLNFIKGVEIMNRLTIYADGNGPTINRHIYGHFAEHLGRCFYDGIWVGEGPAIPNTRGIRDDIVAALRRLNIPNLRWPGGCFADDYHWRDGIGPRAGRSGRVNTHWGNVVETNHFGTHEFMDLCDQLGCEPYICGNVGSGTVQEMRDWLEYMTFAGDSTLANERRQNGHDDPWPLTYWGVGNENWGCGGNMRAEFYADVYRRYATYCRHFDGGTLYRIAGGSYGTNYHWTDVLMREAASYMEGLSLHHYSIIEWSNKGSATDFDESGWFTVLKKALCMDTVIGQHSAIMDRYDPERRVGLIVDEWGTWHDAEPGTDPAFLYQQNTLRDALVAALTLHIFHNHCERVHMANIAQTVNVLQAMVLTQGQQMILTPTYHVFEMFKGHQDATRLPILLDTADYVVGDAAIPQISASASRNAAGEMLVTLCNTSPNRAAELICNLYGTDAVTVAGRALTAESMNTRNTFESPEAIQPKPFEQFSMGDGRLTIELPAMSVVALTLT
ncbi:MAG TPA: alpha-N-arabinofuranosidase [Aggregatilinea sp.]|nr:alpha-N-arabinofuranosidase [Aggregatilinea sp.]HML20927.1 alpha-N-arabinofuranosidase [Aggregatilinea sp.]